MKLEQLQTLVIEWAEVADTNGLYFVSNTGSVKSLPRVVFTYNGGSYITPERILKPFLTGRKGNQYLCVDIDGKTTKIHQLVGACFVKGRGDGLILNHIDENKTNNHFSNLEWVSYSENKLHSIHKNYKCMYLCKNTNKYRVRVQHGGLMYNLGRFNTEVEAKITLDNFIKNNNIKNKYII